MNIDNWTEYRRLKTFTNMKWRHVKWQRIINIEKCESVMGELFELSKKPCSESLKIKTIDRREDYYKRWAEYYGF